MTMRTNRRNAQRPTGAAASMEIYQQVTDRMVELLKTHRVPWHAYAPEQLGAQNMSGRRYRGVNSLMLHPVIAGYDDPRWATFRQVKAAGGSVKKGEKASTAIFWKWLQKTERDDAGQLVGRRIPLLRKFAVFNIEQTTLELETITVREREHTPEQTAESIASAFYAAGGPWIEHSRASLATYNPKLDRVHMPTPEICTSAGAYYSALFHELGHSTGHERRLNRDGITKHAPRGSARYAEEELIAELTACFVRSAAGLEHEGEIENSAAYCRGWMQCLRDDPKLFVRAAGKAQRSADLILGQTWQDQDDDDDSTTEGASATTPAPALIAPPRPIETDPAPMLFG